MPKGKENVGTFTFDLHAASIAKLAIDWKYFLSTKEINSQFRFQNKGTFPLINNDFLLACHWSWNDYLSTWVRIRKKDKLIEKYSEQMMYFGYD